MRTQCETPPACMAADEPQFDAKVRLIAKVQLIAGEGGRRAFLRDRIREDAADRSEQGSRDSTFARDAEFGNLARKFLAAVKPQTKFLQKITGKVGIVGALDSPEAQPVLIFLQMLERFLKFLHRGIE